MTEARTTGPARLIFEDWSGGAYNVTFSWSYDGTKLALIHEGDIWIVPLNSENPTQITDTPENERMVDWSPDGKWLVFLNRSGKRSLGIIPAVGGEAQELYSFDVMGEFTITPAWTPDGKYILFSSKDNPADEEWDMWRFSLETKQAQKLSLKMVGFRHPSIHPDGRHMIFSTEESQTHNSGVWMIENFLLKTETKK